MAVQLNNATKLDVFLEYLERVTGIRPRLTERLVTYIMGAYINRFLQFENGPGQILEIDLELAMRTPPLAALNVIETFKLGRPTDAVALNYIEPQAAPEEPAGPPPAKVAFGAWIATLAGGFYRVGEGDTMADGEIVLHPVDGRRYRKELKFLFYGYHPVEA